MVLRKYKCMLQVLENHDFNSVKLEKFLNLYY